MNNKLLSATALIVTFVSFQASATTQKFMLNGSGVSAQINFTYAVNPNTGVLPGTSPNPVDPIGSYIVTGISGTFSDAIAGITNSAINSIVPSNPGNPEAANIYAPHSFGFYHTVAKDFSYDNLFYPAGSPLVAPASDYPFFGGIFDIYGIVFTLADGNAVNLWSDGYSPDLNYGVAVSNGTNTLDYQFGGLAGSVPEPTTWAMMLGGMGMIGFAARRRHDIRVAYA